MKIVDIEVHNLRVPGWTGESFDGSYDNCVVVVHTEDGLSGIAEVDSVPSVVRAIIEAQPSHRHAMGLSAALAGFDVSDPTAAWDRMYDCTHYYGRRGAVIHAMSAVDIALWDLKGKREGRSVAELLGKTLRQRVKAYGTIYPLGDSEDAVRKNIDRGLALGLKAIKICAEPYWRDDFNKAETLIRAARAHVGSDVNLMIDAAAAWSKPEDGLPLMPVFRELDFDWVEAPLPVDDIEGHRRFQGFGVPIGAGDLGLTTRFEFAQMLERGQADIAQPDVTMVGGLTEVMRVARHAWAAGKRVVPHGYKSNITIAANLAILSQTPTEEFCEYSTSQSPLRWHLTAEDFSIGNDGRIAIPDRPGLGVSLNMDTIRRFRVH